MLLQRANTGPIRVMPIFGTRPEAIKMAPVIRALAADRRFRVITVVTAQHRELLDRVLTLFELRPDHDLDLMRREQSLADLTARALTALDRVMAAERPEIVLVHGDTTTTFAAALASFYHRLPVGHVEAGLRTGDRYRPFPEEANRRLAGALAELHFAPTAQARAHLLAEGIESGRIFVTGNTVVDALELALARLREQGVTRPRTVEIDRPYLLVTAHRRENWGVKMAGICRALAAILEVHPELDLVMPVHPNPAVQRTVRDILAGRPGVHLLPPLDYDEMVLLMSGARLVLTDSGGIQEEAPVFGLPVLVLRDTTERPEAVEAGTVALAGTEEEGIYALARRVLEDGELYARMANAVNPYGDGRAADRIAGILLYAFGLLPEPPRPFTASSTRVRASD